MYKDVWICLVCMPFSNFVADSSMEASLSRLEKIAANRGATGASPSMPAKPSMSATTMIAESRKNASARLKSPMKPLSPPTAPVDVNPPEKVTEDTAKGKKRSFEEMAGKSNVGWPDFVYFGEGWEFDKDMYAKGKEVGPRIEALPREKWLKTSINLSIVNQFIMSVPGSVDFLKERIDELKGDIAQQRTDFEEKLKKAEEEMTKMKANLEKKGNALKEMTTSQKRLEADKVDLNKRVMELEGNADTWAEEKVVLTSEVKKYQGLF
ncbi:uncharacterized protein LOC133315200 [Gastrolobium bilobum]|uniref:uncharacterized protein LOC133315200 n=1 Tax=Gastrolobium bilobum TaxID=150636 RepID=UPI002AB076B7|nr:uncharacterized protein LOC133315200 [Gastrolobium bilobum]